MRKKQEMPVASKEEMEAAAVELVKALEYIDSSMDALKEERKIAIETCVAAGVPKPVVAEIIRRLNMDDDTKTVIDTYVPIIEAHLNGVH